MDQELSPQEIALINEGNALLKSIAPTPSAPAILGPDGMPANAQAPSPMGKSVTEKDIAHMKEVQKKQRDEQRAYIDSLAEELKAITNKDEVALECCSTMLSAFKLIYWAKLELASCDEITDEVIDYAEAHMRTAAYNSQDIHLKDIINQLKHNVIKFAQSRLKNYEQLGSLRRKKIEKLGKLYTNGVTLPEAVSKQVEKTFRVGQMLIVYGDAPSVKAAISAIESIHRRFDGGKTVFMSATEESGLITSHVDASVTIPETYWTDAASTLNRLDDTAEAVLTHNGTMLLIGNLSKMYISDKEKRNDIERKALAMKRVFQWSINNMVATVIGDVVTQETIVPQLYRGFQNFYVQEIREDNKLVGVQFNGAEFRFE